MNMNKDQIKEDFKTSLDKLGKINEAIAANNASKARFSSKIIEKLSQINDKVIEIGTYITTLKDELNTLRLKSNDNSSQIGDKTKEVDLLKAQLTQLDEEKKNAIAELEKLKQQYADSTAQTQTQINECEAKFRELTDVHAKITEQKNALDEQLKKTGVEGEEYAAKLQQLTDTNTQQLQEKDKQLTLLQEQNTAQMKQLQDEIAAKEATFNQQGVDAGEKATQIQSQIEQLTIEKQEKDNQIAQLQADITALKTENEDLIARIIAATQAISSATDTLRQFDDPAAFNETELDAKFKQLELSLQQISNAIQGNSVPINQESGQLLPQQNNVASQLTAQGRLPLDAQIQIDGKNFTLEEIRKQLAEKKRVLSRTNPTGAKKYADALNAIQMAASQEDVIKGLRSNTITFNDEGKIKGGKKTKKTKKNKKQKGGYTYKSNSKRRKISTTSTMRNSSKGRGYTKRR
jgi:chromosome segregation ATPase